MKRTMRFADVSWQQMLRHAGGYTLRNVARCWCFETSRMLGLDLPDELPETVSAVQLSAASFEHMCR